MKLKICATVRAIPGRSEETIYLLCLKSETKIKAKWISLEA
jgi:hypothetical protein